MKWSKHILKYRPVSPDERRKLAYKAQLEEKFLRVRKVARNTEATRLINLIKKEANPMELSGMITELAMYGYDLSSIKTVEDIILLYREHDILKRIRW